MSVTSDLNAALKLPANSVFTVSGTEGLTCICGLMAPAVCPAPHRLAESLRPELTVLSVSLAHHHLPTRPLLKGDEELSF